MTESEAVALIVQAQEGDREAQILLMASHRRIVAKVSEQYAQAGLSSEERIPQLGEYGLGVAIERFTITKGFSFSTYATWWVRQAITKGLGGDGGGAAVHEPRTPLPSAGSASPSADI
jgi:DNA-directed RNA polymerase sigma subunit (sigma70/sigma32)